MCKTDFKHFRTLSGETRRIAMRAHLTAVHGVRFGASHEELTQGQRRTLEDMARAVSWRKGIASRLTVAAAFYVYLSRGVQVAPVQNKPATVRRAFVFGRGHA